MPRGERVVSTPLLVLLCLATQAAGQGLYSLRLRRRSCWGRKRAASLPAEFPWPRGLAIGFRGREAVQVQQNVSSRMASTQQSAAPPPPTEPPAPEADGAAPPPPQAAAADGAAEPQGPARAEPQVDFNDVFSLRKPKDARAGVASGLKSIGKGVAAGVVGLVAGPVIGAKQEGFVGFGKGLAAGEPERPSRGSRAARTRPAVSADAGAAALGGKQLRSEARASPAPAFCRLQAWWAPWCCP